jgi:tetratricopeptide (TPR) repeat protein
MLRLSLILLLFVSFSASAQLTGKYESDYANFYRAEDLFEKGKFSAAQEEYKIFVTGFEQANHPYYVKSRFYIALCALKLYHADAEIQLLDYLKQYPESIYRQDVFFELGRYYFRKNKFKDVIKWFSKVDVHDLNIDLHPEFYFKKGYAYFRQKQPKAARDSFFEIIKIESQYKNPALYYYSHIAYKEKNYEVALEGFKQLENDPAFKKTVPKYIAQILYLQGKYDELIAYAPEQTNDAKQDIEMAHLIGDAFYRSGRYDEAVPFLEEYNGKSATTRDEDYQLGFAYYKSGQYMKAVKTFDKVVRTRDLIGQMALYHIGECYLKVDESLYARNAFELAAAMHFDEEIAEDALYNYAILSYEIDFNPFDEAVEALNLYLERYPESDRNQDIYQYLVNVYTTMKNYRSAMASIDRIENIDFNMKNAYQMMAFNYAVELYEDGKYVEAITNFDLSRRYPVDPHINSLSHYWTAEALYRMQKYDEAIARYKTFLTLPGSYGLKEHNDAYYNIAYCHFKKTDYEPAIQNFRTFTQDHNEISHEKVADSYLRIGDAYFVGAKDEQAIDFYRKAIAENGGQVDYAKYQVGLTQGFQRKYSEKATTMLDIVNNHKNSTFAVSALYEAAEAFRLNNQNSKAMQHYEKLVIDYPTNAKVVYAVFQIASLNFINDDFSAAEKGYLRVINEFSNESMKREALARLKDVYTALNQPEKYVALINDHGGMSNLEKDSLLFFNAFNLFEDSLYQKSIDAFDGYLKEFSAPIFFVEANYYKAVAHQRLGQEEKANTHYSQVLSKSNGSYTEVAALFSAQHEYDHKNYVLAMEHYKKLKSVATYPENKLTASIGLMRSHALLNQYQEGGPYAKMVLKDELSLSNVITEAHYVIAKGEMETANYNAALPEFKEVTKASNGSIGAESQYNIALIYNLQEEYKKSEDEVRILMSEHASYGYWSAKGLIVQAKNFIGLEDYVQAELTLNSVLANYSIQDDGVIDEANEVMQVLQGLKTREKEIDTSDPDTIEIGGGEE